MTRTEIVAQLQHHQNAARRHMDAAARLTALLGDDASGGPDGPAGAHHELNLRAAGFLTVGEAAGRWRCAEITIRRWVKRHPDIAERVGGKLYIRPDAPAMIKNDYD